MTQTASWSDRRPVTIVVAAISLALEALIALGYAALEIGQVRMSRAVVGVGVTILMACFGLFLLLRGAQRVPRQEMEPGTGRGHSVDLAPAGVELCRWWDHLGIGWPSRVSDRSSGRCTAPPVDRGIRRAAC
jgi:hypothetical protein